MTTHTVRLDVLWAVLAMEAAVALPIMAVTAPGEGNARIFNTFLLVLLLPAGFLCVRGIPTLRDPAWRILVGFALVIALRSQVQLSGGEGAAAAMARFLQAIVPASLAFALWWRGGSFADAELVAADIHLEFLFGSCALLLLLLVFHGLVAVDPQVLVWSAGLFIASSVVALALARQDAADAAAMHGGRILGSAIGLIPVGATVVLLMVFRPDVMAALWMGVARLIELVLMPLLLLLSWLASLLPPIGAPADFRPPPRTLGTRPDIDALARQQQPPDWIPAIALTLVLLVVLFMAAGILRLLLESEVMVRPRPPRPPRTPGMAVERSGDAGDDARELLGWLLAWLRNRFARPSAAVVGAELPAADAWTAYRRLLDWADQHGVKRRPTETTQQLQSRLIDREPTAAEVVGLVTTTFESERYGQKPLRPELLQRVQQAVRELFAAH